MPTHQKTTRLKQIFASAQHLVPFFLTFTSVGNQQEEKFPLSRKKTSSGKRLGEDSHLPQLVGGRDSLMNLFSRVARPLKIIWQSSAVFPIHQKPVCQGMLLHFCEVTNVPSSFPHLDLNTKDSKPCCVHRQQIFHK